mgnify:CR=1 FL=1
MAAFSASLQLVKILEGCFNVDKNGYQLIVYNSQPFNDRHLDLDMIVDSVNQIWTVDKSGRFVRSTKKSKYVNFIWQDIDNHHYQIKTMRMAPTADQLFSVKQGKEILIAKIQGHYQVERLYSYGYRHHLHFAKRERDRRKCNLRFPHYPHILQCKCFH